MKRYLAVGAIVLALAATIWGLIWWAGRGEVARALDDGVAQLNERGWTVSWDEREIGGFPFGYNVHLTGLTAVETVSGFVLRLPSALAETGGADRIVLHPSEPFEAELPRPASLNLARPDQGEEVPARIPVTGETDDLVLVLAADGTAEMTADRIALTTDDPAIGLVTQTVEGLEATLVPDAPGARYRMHAGLVTSMAMLPDDQDSVFAVTLRDVAAEGASTLPTAEALAEMLYAGGPGRAEGALSVGAAEVRLAGVTIGVAGAPGEVSWRAEGLNGEVLLTSGRIELEGAARGNVWAIASPDRSLPVQGQISVALARAHYAMPMAPSERPDLMALGLGISGAEGDERFWGSIDPNGALPREPASLKVDLSGTARVTRRIDELRPGSPPPFEISSILLEEVSAEALGATLQAAGEVEILQPIGLPLGEIQVGVTGLAALVRTLGQAGVLSPAMETTADAIMQVYLRPATGADAWTANIGFTRQGTEVNGRPVP